MKLITGIVSLLFALNTLQAQEWIETTDFNRQIGISSNGLLGYTEYVWGRDIKQSRVVIPFQYTWAGSFDKAGHAVVQLNGKTGMIDTLGRYVIPAVYDFVYSFSNGYATVYRNGKFGAVDAKGTLVIPLEYDYLSAFKKGGRADAVKGSKWGVIDTKNKVILPFEYPLTMTDDKNYTRAFVKEWGYFDPTGKPVFDETYQALSHEANGLIEAYLTTGKTVLMNARHEKLLPPDLKFESLNKKGTHVIVEKEDKYGLYDLANKKLTLPVEFQSLEFDGDLVKVQKTYKLGPAWFASLDGKKLFGKEFNYIRAFSDYTGFAEVSANNKWGLVDRNGQLILPIAMGAGNYSEIHVDMEAGRISSLKGSLWGMTDLKGNIVLPYQYTSSLGGSNNPFYFIGDSKMAVVTDKNSGKRGVVDHTGNWILKPGESPYSDFGVMSQFVQGDGVYVPVERKGKWGVFDLITRKEIIKPQLERFGSVEYAHATYLDARDKWGLVHYSTGKVYKPGTYEFVDFDDETNLLIVEKDKKVGLADLNEKIVVPVVYDKLSYDSESNLYFAVRNGKAGFIDVKGKEVIPFKYEPLSGMYPNNWVEGHVRMLLNGKSVMLDKNGKVVATASDFKGPADMFFVCTRFAGPVFCFMGKFENANGDEVMRILLNGRLYENIGGDMNNTGSGTLISFAEGLMAAKRNGLYGYLDHNGNEVIPFVYERASPFSNGVAYVKKEGKLFIINRKGEKLPHADMSLALLARFNK